jgi:hypothetical protein
MFSPAAPFGVAQLRALPGRGAARGRKRSSADFTFCCIAIDHFKRTPEETAAKLLEVSSKARENGETYALDQAMSAAAKVALNPRSPAR